MVYRLIFISIVNFISAEEFVSTHKFIINYILIPFIILKNSKPYFKHIPYTELF